VTIEVPPVVRNRALAMEAALIARDFPMS